jgi:protease secretion system outer membrane protein
MMMQTQKRLQKSWFVVAAFLCCSAELAHAAPGELVENFERAKLYEPLFQAARAERDVNIVSSRVSRSALYPELRVNSSQLETENTVRTTVSIIQPIVSADRFATFQEGPPRELLADATYQSREQELVQRYFKAVLELVRAREGLSLNQAKVDALAQQAKSAKRTFELGSGTITDLRDAQVRLDQAHATDVTLAARLANAQRQFESITGVPPGAHAFVLARKNPAVSLLPMNDYLVRVAQGNPQLVAARQNKRIAELAVTRAKGAFLPTLNAVATRSHAAGSDNNYVGLQLSFPLQAGNFYQVYGALANVERFNAQTKDLEQHTKLEVERLRELVEAGRAEIEIRLQGIQSAELSVEANEKSFLGGVRSKVDVINSIQTLYQTKDEHLNAVLTLAENLLNLHIQLDTPIPESLGQIESILFTPG